MGGSYFISKMFTPDWLDQERVEEEKVDHTQSEELAPLQQLLVFALPEHLDSLQLYDTTFCDTSAREGSPTFGLFKRS